MKRRSPIRCPAPVTEPGRIGDLLDMLIAPIRSGFVLTRRSLAAGADAALAGYRIGERRFTLRAMLEQAPAETLGWLADEAARWSRRHAAAPAGSGARLPGRDITQAWWARRADHTARLLATTADRAGGDLLLAADRLQILLVTGS